MCGWQADRSRTGRPRHPARSDRRAALLRASLPERRRPRKAAGEGACRCGRHRISVRSGKEAGTAARVCGCVLFDAGGPPAGWQGPPPSTPARVRNRRRTHRGPVQLPRRPWRRLAFDPAGSHGETTPHEHDRRQRAAIRSGAIFWQAGRPRAKAPRPRSEFRLRMRAPPAGLRPRRSRLPPAAGDGVPPRPRALPSRPGPSPPSPPAPSGCRGPAARDRVD